MQSVTGARRVAFPAALLMADDTDDILDRLGFGPIAGGDARSTGHVGTRALMLAVLEEAIRSYCGPPGAVRAQAEAWVRSPSTSAFSFVTVCEILGLEPEAVRRVLPGLQRGRGPRVRPNVIRTRRTRVVGRRRRS